MSHSVRISLLSSLAVAVLFGQASGPAGTGTVTSITCGTGLTGGTITVSGTCAIASTVVTVASAPSANDFIQVDRSYAANCVNASAGSAWDTTLSAACVGGSNNLGGVLPFTDGGTAQFKWEIPADWDTAGQPYVSLHFSSGSNTTGTVIFNVALACTKADGSVTWDPAFNAADSMATKTMATANREWSTSVQVTQMTSGNNCVPGGWAIIKITRATDTAASAVNVDMAVITSPRKTVFQAN